MPVSDLAKILAMGDPEAAGAATASNAMAPVVSPYLRDVLSGQYALQGLQGANDAFRNRDYEALAAMFGPGAIKAYHASPYDFSQFDASKIGTGQGAQAYGHGLYMAESPAVSGAKGQYDHEFTAKNLGKPDLNQGEASVLRMLRDNATDGDVIGDLARNGYSFEDALSTLNKVKDARAKIYEVNINAEPDQFLHWDKPLSEQPNVVQALERSGIAEPPKTTVRDNTYGGWGGYTGSQLYESSHVVPGAYRDQATASARLRDAGIPGIRYLDQGSRGAGQGTSNYVVFDPSIVDITKKYGLAALLAGAAGTGTDQ